MEDSVIEMLENQEFDALLKYSFNVNSINKAEKGEYSVLDNGTIVAIISKEEAIEAMNR